jgi:membrane associated rhomboid family serine protease
MFSGQRMTSPVVINIIIANVVAWLAIFLWKDSGISAQMLTYGALNWVEAPEFRVYQVFTYMFLHVDLWHLFFNMWALWMFGRILEYEIGSRRFFIYYMTCGIGAGLIQLLAGWAAGQYLMSEPIISDDAATVISGFIYPTIGASGAVFGLLLAFGLMHPNNRIMLLIPPIPMKAKWFVLVYGLLEFFLVLLPMQTGIAHLAHLGGMLWGFLLLWWWKHKREIYY